MPRLWSDTIETHRHDVREAILDSAGTVVHEHGPLAATMSRIAEEAGIGRATLYKYFPDVEDVLRAWHERHVTEHLNHLTALASESAAADERLEAVLMGYASICYHRQQHGAGDLGVLLHQGETVTEAESGLRDLFRGLLAEAGNAGDIRDDMKPGELAEYCLHALSAAGSLPSEAAAKRLVAITMTALRPPA